MSEQDYANVAWRVQLLVDKGYSVRFAFHQGRYTATCDTYKVRVGMGDTMGQALAALQRHLLESGFMKEVA